MPHTWRGQTSSIQTIGTHSKLPLHAAMDRGCDLRESLTILGDSPAGSTEQLDGGAAAPVHYSTRTCTAQATDEGRRTTRHSTVPICRRSCHRRFPSRRHDSDLVFAVCRPSMSGCLYMQTGDWLWMTLILQSARRRLTVRVSQSS